MSTLMPVYHQIKLTIKEWIDNKEFYPGEKIPSENVLAERFKVSRVTVRQAISQLVQDGLLQSRRGFGTIVSSPKENYERTISLESKGFSAEILHQVQMSKTRSVEITKIIAPNLVRNALQLKPDEEVVKIERVRYTTDVPTNHVVNYLPVSLGSRIKKDDLMKQPLLVLLAHNLKVTFTETYQTITASFANAELAEKLGVPSGSPVLQVERIMYTKKDRPILFSQIHYRGDLFKYIVRFRNVRTKDGKPWTPVIW